LGIKFQTSWVDNITSNVSLTNVPEK